MTPEEAVMLSYARGMGFSKNKNSMQAGRMAVVGVSKEKILKKLPEGIYLACHNGSQSVTISGPKEKTEKFVLELQSEGIFAKVFDSCDIAFHTKYSKEAFSSSFSFLKTLLKNPLPRSSKWISTSVSHNNGTIPDWSKYNSPEYHYNNMCNTVLFCDALKEIPENAIIIEVSPHCLFQSILRKELSSEVTYIPLQNKNAEDPVQFLLTAFGKYVILIVLHCISGF